MNKNMSVVKIENATPRMADIAFSKPINWTIQEKENWAIVGPNGAGKSLLIDILIGKHALKTGNIETLNNRQISSVVKSVAFSDIYSIVDTQNSYYQQRWNTSCEADSPLVRSLFAKGEKAWVDRLINAFNITDLIDKEINLLSSGELRKTLIIRSLLSKPQILVLDNPFIGLDFKSRDSLNTLFKNLSDLDGIQIVLVVSDPRDIPELITNILPIKDKNILEPTTRVDFIKNTEFINDLFDKERTINLSQIINNTQNNLITFTNALVFNNIKVKYGNRSILNDLNWQVKKGDKWALLGENGSGKSTILSLVAGDNPQAYANDITLFDRKRGTGESIWDIKKRIGYISPEMHLYYLKNVPCIDVVASGFFDTIGLYKKCNDAQKEIAIKWMELFGIEKIKDRSFIQISTGEQRLALLARVFVKNPDLLILDEPLHGLDIENKKHIKKIIEDFCTSDKSLIYVTHYEEEIPHIVDKKLRLKKTGVNL